MATIKSLQNVLVIAIYEQSWNVPLSDQQSTTTTTTTTTATIYEQSWNEPASDNSC